MSVASYNGASTCLADFKQLAKLGEGAYSCVYKVQRIADHRTYALKNVKLPSLSEKEKQNALNEVRLLASVQNENIIAYKEAFFDEKARCLCIVQEIADSGDLLMAINKCKQERSYLPEADVWRYLDGMCRGLKALHDLKILHRDMKCANVFLSSSRNGPIAKLGDFNVSKVAKRGLCMTQTGTPYYASPEVWRDMPYDAKSDMWSMGCVLYEMVALRPPFRAEDMEGLYKKVVRGQYPRIPAHYSKDLADVIAALLQVHPRNRPGVDQLLELPAMLRNTIYAYPQAEIVNTSDLLNTIKLPKNMIDLSDCLPKSRYASSVGDLSSVGSVNEKSIRDRAYNQSGASLAPRRQGGEAASIPRTQSLPRAAPRSRPTPITEANSGNYLQEATDASVLQQRPPRLINPAYSGEATPTRGQAAIGVHDSLDAYLQQQKDPPDNNNRSRVGCDTDLAMSKVDPYPNSGSGTPVAAHNQYRGTEAPRGMHGGASSSANPTYNAPSQQGGGRPPRERRPMSIYAKAQYAVGEQSQHPQQDLQPQQQPKADSQKEAPGTNRRLRSLIPRIF